MRSADTRVGQCNEVGEAGKTRYIVVKLCRGMNGTLLRSTPYTRRWLAEIFIAFRTGIGGPWYAIVESPASCSRPRFVLFILFFFLSFRLSILFGGSRVSSVLGVAASGTFGSTLTSPSSESSLISLRQCISRQGNVD